MNELSDFERAVLEKLLAGEHPTLVKLRAQACVARLSSRESSGAGFFLDFDVPESAPALPEQSLTFGDVLAELDGLKHGAGFVLFVREGRLATLEGYSNAEPWPAEVRGFTLSYAKEPRAPFLGTGT